MIELLPTNPFEMEKKGISDFKLVGINEVYTFKGFCNKHDTGLFKNIETNSKINFNDKNQQILYCYRGLCQEIRRKEISIEWINDVFKFLPLFHQNLILEFRNGLYEGLKNLNFFKTKIENSLIGNNFDLFHLETIKIPKIELCISVPLNITNPNDNLNVVPFPTSFINVFPKGNDSFVICGFHKNYPCNWTIELIKRLKNGTNKEIFKELSDLLTLRLEFWTMSPSLYQKINKNDLLRYKKTFTENIFNHNPTLQTDINLFRSI